jgi:hypothetical protein
VSIGNEERKRRVLCFTEADGVTPYSNDSYVVTFIAFDPTTLTVTNKIDGTGVRVAAGCILTYEEEDPALGPYFNSEASKWVGGLAAGLYQALYDGDPFSLTQYFPSDIGTNRDNPLWISFPLVLTHANEMNWASQTCYWLTNLAFSDFGYYQGHAIGGWSWRWTGGFNLDY